MIRPTDVADFPAPRPAETIIGVVKAEMKHPTDHSVYLIASRLGLAKIGVAPEPRQRLRELQVGSPVRLELALAEPYATREEARAVAEELAQRFAARLCLAARARRRRRW